MSCYPGLVIHIKMLLCYNVTRAFCSFRVESQSLIKYESYETSKISLKTSGHEGHSEALVLKVSHLLSIKVMKYQKNP